MTLLSSLQIRKSKSRGLTNHGWLHSRHTFSFAEYYDQEQMGFRSLRVINEDKVAPNKGFGSHPHKDMEIFSYILSGSLQHQDSLGNGSRLVPGQIQLISAGTGIFHSEFNPSTTEDTHFLQIWIQPSHRGLKPAYSEWQAPEGRHYGKLLIISEDGRQGTCQIRQDVEIYRIILQNGQCVTHEIQPGRGVWVQVAKGSVEINGEELQAGDGVATEIAELLLLKGTSETELLLFDLA